MTDNLQDLQDRIRQYFKEKGDDGDQRTWRDFKDGEGIDPLTGFLNRKIFKERAMLVLGRARPFTVIMFDLDKFKDINDTFGHEAGDLVLKDTSDLVRKHIRDEDLACRWGGEEIVLLLPDVVGDAEAISERLRYEFEARQIVYNIKNIKRTASFGVTSGAGFGELDQAIKSADIALYDAKKAGRNIVRMRELD